MVLNTAFQLIYQLESAMFILPFCRGKQYDQRVKKMGAAKMKNMKKAFRKDASNMTQNANTGMLSHSSGILCFPI